jgi:hypothetical protein
MSKNQEEKKKALSMIKAVYDDGIAEINGREYKFLGTTHIKRRRVFAFYSSLQQTIKSGDMRFLDSPEFVPVEKVINEMVEINGSILTKSPDHWEEFPEDYMQFISIAMGVISYPFLRGSLTA